MGPRKVRVQSFACVRDVIHGGGAEGNLRLLVFNASPQGTTSPGIPDLVQASLWNLGPP